MTSKEHLPLPQVEEIAKLPPDGGSEFNRLIHEKSPYLLQHARNPVDWYPWGEEAFEKARKEDKPIFLSVGYSTCHWCHVMEEDSFDHREVADILNRYYISIKVDREERPDIDEIYMNATQLITNKGGGWPNSVWLLPDKRPWYAGTFFPREDIQGQPGFKTVLLGLAEFWRHRRQEVIKQAGQLTEVLKRISDVKHLERTGEPSRELVSAAIAAMEEAFDEEHGGFGNAPKFPPHSSLSLLFYEYRRTEDARLLHMATRTLDAIAKGGIHDHIGGGFHRYSTDSRWLLPHFEKMLYDNTQLARSFVDGFLATGNRDYREAAADIFGWISREMKDKRGGFYSALDADSEGVEGKYYFWTHDEVVAVLGEREGELLCRAYNVKPEGNFREEATGKARGSNILHRTRSFRELADEEGIPEDEFRSRLADARHKLLQRRNMRVRPHLDDKVLTDWNGLLIGSLAYAGKSLGESSYIKAAERAARFVTKTMETNGRLLKTFRDGEARLDAYLDDYAFLGDGLLDLYEATQKKAWLNEAIKFAGILIEKFYDESTGGFYFVPSDHPEQLLSRLKDPLDKALPSGNGIAARVLIRLGHITGEGRYLDIARKCLEAFQPIMQQAPRGTESLIQALAMFFDGARATESLAGKTGDEADASMKKKPVTVEAYSSKTTAAPGETIRVAIKLTMEEGWHLNSNKPLQKNLLPTSVELRDTPAVSLAEMKYPAGTQVSFDFSPEPLSVYEETIWITAFLRISENADEGLEQMNFILHMQPCSNEACGSPQEVTLSIPLQIARGRGEEAARHQELFDALEGASLRQGKE
jgi:hypothetical protein